MPVTAAAHGDVRSLKVTAKGARRVEWRRREEKWRDARNGRSPAIGKVRDAGQRRAIASARPPQDHQEWKPVSAVALPARTARLSAKLLLKCTSMIRLPILQHFEISNYGLFPGDPRGSGISRDVGSGLTLIAGINGLGKTTLLTAILRALTGPYDLTSDGPPSALGVSIPEVPVPLNTRVLRFFSQRVADEAEEAVVGVVCTFDRHVLSVRRRLQNLDLLDCRVDDIPIDLSGSRRVREAGYQAAIRNLVGVGSFVDVLLILHHVMLFHEDRMGALWDTNAQRHVLRALFLEAEDAARVAELERLVQSTDSQARNVQTRITATEIDLRNLRHAEEGAEGILAQLEAEQVLLDADLVEAKRLNESISNLEEERRETRLTLEKAKVERQEANASIEQMKYGALLELYPTVEDAARLAMARLISDGFCLVCRCEAPQKQEEMNELIAQGRCPICGSESPEERNVIGRHRFERAKMRRARERASIADQEVLAKEDRIREIAADYDAAVNRLSVVRQAIDDRKSRHRALRANLPQNITSEQLERALEALNSQLLEWEGRRATHLRELRSLIAAKQELITSRSAQLMKSFSQLTRQLLAEEARLVEVTMQPRYTQSAQPGKPLTVPAFSAEMTAATRPGFVRRMSPTDVSESQRELIDLAFRLSLVRAATSGKSCTFVMETPEASLDGLAMERVGRSLARFSHEKQNRLVVTSNLSNAGIITALFGGRTRSRKEVAERRGRTVNLLKVAEPNRALEKDARKYQRLLDAALSGAGAK
jgi:AAA domain-containing protein